MKKFISIALIICATISMVMAQKNVYKTTSYAENSNGSWSANSSSSAQITVNQDDSFIEIDENGDQLIFQITKKAAPAEKDGNTITEFTCSDNEAQECKVVVSKGKENSITFIYPDLKYKYQF